MFRPFFIFMGLRYTRAKRRNHFISFISFASMLGIALGVAVLITVLSVMNGFDEQIRTRFFDIAPQVTVISPEAITNHTWQPLAQQLATVSGVAGAAPFIDGKGMLVHDGVVSGVEVVGIIPAEEQHISALSQKIVDGSLSALQPGKFGIVLGQKLAINLGTSVGDTITLFTPEANSTPFGLIPRFREFTVVGIFNTQSGFGFDAGVVYIAMQDAAALFPGGQAVVGMHVKLQDLYAAPHVTDLLQAMLPPGFYVSNWTEQFGAFFKALAMEKTMMFVILLLIVAVATFNLVSTLVMVVNEKRADIAILRTLGAKPRTVMGIFMVQGLIVGVVGTCLGVVGGLLLSWNATAIVSAIQHTFHVQLVSSSVYFVDYLPSEVSWRDVWQIAGVSLGLSILATLYPAWMAARTNPAEALRYE